jgi:hypothetical protein
MTMMLYNLSMNMKSIYPESTPSPFGKTGLKIRAWGIVTVITAGIPFIFRHHSDWNPSLKFIIALAPIMPGQLWALNVARWIRGLDELQRRIQSGALFFAAIWTVSITTAVNSLQECGVLNIDLPPSRFSFLDEEFCGVLQGKHGLGWLTTVVLMCLLWNMGLIIFNRRYK